MYTEIEKETFAREASEAVGHEKAMGVYADLMKGLKESGCPPQLFFMIGLAIAGYGATVAAVARAQALGLDPQQIMFTDEEIAARVPATMERIRAEFSKLMIEETLRDQQQGFGFPL